MRQLKIQELNASLGDIVVCVTDNTNMFTKYAHYEVEQAEDGRVGIMTDCRFIATTSASLFTTLEEFTLTEADSVDDDAPASNNAVYVTQMRSTIMVLPNDNFRPTEIDTRQPLQEVSIAA